MTSTLTVLLMLLAAVYLWVEGRNRKVESEEEKERERRVEERHAEVMERLDAIRETIEQAADAEHVQTGGGERD